MSPLKGKSFCKDETEGRSRHRQGVWHTLVQCPISCGMSLLQFL